MHAQTQALPWVTHFRPVLNPRRLKTGLQNGTYRTNEIGELERQCSCCGDHFPYDDEFFHRASDRKTGLGTICRACILEQVNARRELKSTADTVNKPAFAGVDALFALMGTTAQTHYIPSPVEADPVLVEETGQCDLFDFAAEKAKRRNRRTFPKNAVPCANKDEGWAQLSLFNEAELEICAHPYQRVG
ncbi:hypothetical protein A4U49_15485 [Acidithiobacillus ferrivorans]|uniref:hypothetical protein n=1 Tax=Acidithiobacillus ferrivorans TaxID=160808 RepID=UPI0008934705|nr:hypothetical protein [Acidithiobacillus ferrivorans]OFA14979.1 hypothetical protein A4U49_15485 [Acidithiobacillus ferrivorans]